MMGVTRATYVEQYDKVFDKDGNVKLCRRDECRKLIEIAQKLVNGVDFGDVESGKMNIEKIKWLKDYINK